VHELAVLVLFREYLDKPVEVHGFTRVHNEADNYLPRLAEVASDVAWLRQLLLHIHGPHVAVVADAVYLLQQVAHHHLILQVVHISGNDGTPFPYWLKAAPWWDLNSGAVGPWWPRRRYGKLLVARLILGNFGRCKRMHAKTWYA